MSSNLNYSKHPKKNTTGGWINGFIGVLIFSGSLPATRAAVIDLSPFFVTFARASIAGVLALSALLIFKEKYPTKKQFIHLIIVALGVVIGFPLLSALALQYVTSAHSLVLNNLSCWT
ncbi:MAG TPA: EamA family transporter [Arachidicoccus sp.]|nr:EamA family transporter [Arachidicoccus sp.]